MPNITWDESLPSDSESAGLGDDRIRSLKSSVRIGLDAEHNWPAAGGDAGVHRLGSGRPYVGSQSLVSSTGTDGRLFWASDTSRFFHVGSGGTALIGGPTMLSVGSFPDTAPQRHYWAVEFGNSQTASSGTTSVAIPNSGFSGVPWVQVTYSGIAADSGVARIVGAFSKTASSFVVGTYTDVSTRVGGIVFDWVSIGSRVL